jgi:hypothetical protein
MSVETNGSAACPPEILDWIPWYADDALPESQRGAVEAHAAGCAACRAEIAMLADGAMPEVNAPDADAVFAKVLARIETAAPAPGVVAVGGHLAPAAARQAPARPSARPLRARAFARIAIAASFLAVATLGWVARDLFAQGTEPVYQTAAAPESAALATAGPALDVVFRTGISIERINTDLHALGAAVVSGPSEAGRYRVVLPAGANPTAAAAMLRAEGSGVATFVEPVRP